MRSKPFALLILLAVSCVERGKTERENAPVYQPDTNALKLNNKAAKLMSRAFPYNDSLNSILYDSALIYLNQAIKTDSLFLAAYTNKAKVLLRKNLPEQSLEALSKVQMIKPDFAEAIMGQGFLLEKMGKMELADRKYKQALEAYKKRLSDETKKVKVQSDIAFLYLFLEDKNKAIDEIQNLILENPDNDQLKATEGYIKDFDRKKFIAEY